MNCWEFTHCGREAGGKHVRDLGQCPAYPDHGMHCARVVGTMCTGVVQGTFAEKLGECVKCDFYRSDNYDKTFHKLLQSSESDLSKKASPDSNPESTT
jgi:hypothetical protein